MGAPELPEPPAFPSGVTFFYLWLAMGLEAKSKGLPLMDAISTQGGASEVWAATIAAVGVAPPVSQVDGIPVF